MTLAGLISMGKKNTKFGVFLPIEIRPAKFGVFFPVTFER